MDPRQHAVPERDAICSRYKEPRRLRTRTMGTPFWIRSERGELIVTTSSGNDRHVRWDEVDATWPHIARGNPRHLWRELTNNSSYLEPIFDDLNEAGLGQQQRQPAVAERRLEKCTAEYVKLRTRFRTESASLREEAESAKTELFGLRMELESAKEALEHERHWGDTANVEQIKNDLAAERETRLRLEIQLQSVRQETEHKATDLERVNAALEVSSRELQAQLGGAIDARDEAEGKLVAISEQLRLAELKLQAAASKPKPQPAANGQKVPSSDFTQLMLALGVTERIAEPRERSALVVASRELADDPERAVLECRRVLERCSRSIWRDAYPDQQPPERFVETMSDIRDNGVLPAPDWHLMKNLYSRSSDIVHNGGANKESALWIWLGTAEVAELAGAKRPQVHA